MLSPQAEKQAAAFDAIGERYDEAFAHKGDQEAATRWLAGVLPPGAQVLDAGCGSGVPTARLLVEAGHQVLGIDISQEMLRLARRNVPRARFERRALTDPALPADHFQAVTAFFSLLMLPQEEFVPAARNLRRVLRPGGYMLLSMVEGNLDYVPLPFLGQLLHVSAFPRAQVEARLAEAGLEVLEVSTVDYPPPTPQAPPERQLFFRCRRPA